MIVRCLPDSTLVFTEKENVGNTLVSKGQDPILGNLVGELGHHDIIETMEAICFVTSRPPV